VKYSGVPLRPPLRPRHPVFCWQHEQVKQAETVLENAGVRGCRVRHHGAVARIEAPLAHLSLLISDPIRQRLADKLRQIGFNHVCLDLEGYVTGSMNRSLSTKDAPL
jgi:uncharacterized protein